MDLSLIVFVALCVAAAGTGVFFQPGSWYESLRKPSWTPPNWLFGPVWTILYICIAVAGWLVWREAGWSTPIVFWSIQLVANAAWSWLFFGMKRMDVALVDAGVMWLSIAGFIVTAADVSATATLLFAPYLIWVTIAFALNLTVMRMNAGAAATTRSG